MSNQNEKIAAFLLSLPNDEFVAQCYFRLLGRAPDSEGLQGYLSELGRGVPKTQLLTNIAGSEEALAFAARRGMPPLLFDFHNLSDQPASRHSAQLTQSDVWDPNHHDDAEFVKSAYLALLGREADEGGLSAYTQALSERHMSRAHVVALMVGSEEGKSHGASLPDWAAEDLKVEDQLVVKDQPLAEMVEAPHELRSVDAAAMGETCVWLLDAQDDVEFVRSAYLVLLGREADEGGLSTYTQALSEKLMSRAHLVALMVDSEEGRAHGASLPDWAANELQAEISVAHDLGAAKLLAAPVEPSGSAFVASTYKPSNVAELLALDGGAFVMAAYMATLGRSADEGGYNHYLHLLDTGWSKMHVLSSLLASEEGKATVVNLDGLDARLKAYHKAQRRSWGGWYYRSVLGVESDLPSERQLRTVSNLMGRL